jgi:hypothetical protein
MPAELGGALDLLADAITPRETLAFPSDFAYTLHGKFNIPYENYDSKWLLPISKWAKMPLRPKWAEKPFRHTISQMTNWAFRLICEMVIWLFRNGKNNISRNGHMAISQWRKTISTIPGIS